MWWTLWWCWQCVVMIISFKIGLNDVVGCENDSMVVGIGFLWDHSFTRVMFYWQLVCNFFNFHNIVFLINFFIKSFVCVSNKLLRKFQIDITYWFLVHMISSETWRMCFYYEFFKVFNVCTRTVIFMSTSDIIAHNTLTPGPMHSLSSGTICIHKVYTKCPVLYIIHTLYIIIIIMYTV